MPVRRRTAWSTALLVLVFALSLPAVTTRFYASDEIQFFAWLRSAAFDHDADFDNEYRYFHDSGAIGDDGFRTTFLDGTNEAGRRRNFTPIGTAVLWAPFFAAGHLVAVTTGAPADGLSQPYIAAVTFGSAVYGFLTLLLTHAIVRRVIGGTSWVAIVAVWLGTPLVFYMYVAPGFSHACSAFAVSLFFWIWLRVRGAWTPAGAAALGASAALMAMVREQDVFVAAGPALDFLRWTARSAAPGRIGLRTAGAGVVAAVLAYLPQLAAYQALNGHPSPTREVARKMTWWSPHAAGVLWSPEHGLFFWTPLALVAVCGLVWLAVRRPRDAAPDASWIALVALLMFALLTYVSGSVESWTVAGSFGQRRFVALTPILGLGLASAIHRLRDAGPAVRALGAAALAVLVWWNVGLMAQFGLHLMDRQRLTLGRNVRVTFVELPSEMPSLVTRYFTDRASFYRQPRRD